MYSIAVLDDEIHLAQSIANYLSSCGFDTTSFVTSERLLVSNAAKPFDAVVTDWCLDHVMQEDTIWQLRTIPGFRANPILVLTGWHEESPQYDQLRRVAGAAHLAVRVKPYSVKQLADDLLALIEGRQKYDHRPQRVPYGRRLSGVSSDDRMMSPLQSFSQVHPPDGPVAS